MIIRQCRRDIGKTQTPLDDEIVHDLAKQTSNCDDSGHLFTFVNVLWMKHATPHLSAIP